MGTWGDFIGVCVCVNNSNSFMTVNQEIKSGPPTTITISSSDVMHSAILTGLAV